MGHSLNTFLTLSESERKNIAPIIDFVRHFQARSPLNASEADLYSFNKTLNHAEIKFLRDLIVTINLSPLIKIAIRDPQINALCNHPALNDIWNERWRLCGHNPNKEDKIKGEPIHEYQPQLTIGTFELLKGIYIYSQYMKYNKSREPEDKAYAKEYLQEAAHLGYFPALNALCSHYLRIFSEQATALLYAHVAAELYWTPGYLLLSVTYFLQRDYLAALLNLIIAEKLIPRSAPMINNAYHGKPLTDITKPLIQKLGVSSWDEAKVELATRAGVPLSFVTNTLYTKAQNKVTQIIESVQQKTEASHEQDELCGFGP